MFLCVTATPRFRNGMCIFDRKIGCFSLVTYEQAQRSSVNRPAGTWVVKPITSITRDVIREFMIEKVIPAIRAKWPRKDINKPIYIVQDNAPSHLEKHDPLFCDAAKEGGFDIRLVFNRPIHRISIFLTWDSFVQFNLFNIRRMSRRLKILF